MMRGLFFCQHMWGVGHLYRSLRLSQELIKDFEIDFVQGGRRVEGASLVSSNFHHHYLTPLHDEERFLKEDDPRLPVMIKARREEMEEVLKPPFDFIITEHFPLGRQFLAPELIWMIEEVKRKKPDALVVSVHRGITRSHKNEELAFYDSRGFSLLERYFDKLFVLTDPHVIRLDQTTTVPDDVKKKLIYTGFVVDPIDMSQEGPKKREIVVSSGSGTHADEFLLSTLDAAKEWKEHTFRFFIGEDARKECVRVLQEASGIFSHIKVEGFTEQFTQVLFDSCLMIGNGGNTVVDAAYTRTPSLIYPLDKGMTQLFVAHTFAEWGCVRLLTKDDLKKERLLKEIARMLEGERPQQKGPIDFDGASHFVNSIKILLKEKQEQK